MNQDRALIFTAAIERRHPGALAEIHQVQEAAELVEVCARVAFDTARAAGNFSSDDALAEFVSRSVGNTAALEADINRQLASLAEAA